MIKNVYLEVMKRSTGAFEMYPQIFPLSSRITIGTLEDDAILMPPPFQEFRAAIYTARGSLYYLKPGTQSHTFVAAEYKRWTKVNPGKPLELRIGTHLRLGPRLSCAKVSLDIRILDII